MIKNRYLLKNIILISFLLFISCNKDKNNESWLKAGDYYESKNYNKCAVELMSIINDNNSNLYKPKALFLLSEIYLNEYKEYLISIDYLNEIMSKYPENELSKRAHFTKAYIYANYLDQYSDAIILYNDFLLNYPNDELVSSVEYELNELDKYSNIINNILNPK